MKRFVFTLFIIFVTVNVHSFEKNIIGESVQRAEKILKNSKEISCNALDKKQDKTPEFIPKSLIKTIEVINQIKLSYDHKKHHGSMKIVFKF